MALGVRLKAYGSSEQGDAYRISFIEDGYFGTAPEVDCYYPTGIIRYQSDIADRLGGGLIISYTDIYLVNSATVQLFLDDLLEKQQSGFYVKIERSIGGTGTYYTYWMGTVLQDQTQRVEDAYPHLVRISATDGLALLKGIDYDFSNVDAATSSHPASTNLVEIIAQCLKQGTSPDLWGASDYFINTTVDWWEEVQTYSASTDPMAQHCLDVQGFNEKKISAGTSYGPDILESEYLSCYEVLKEIARVYIARIYQCDGVWIFEQVPLRSATAIKRMRYTKTISSGSVYQLKSMVKTLDESTMKNARGVDNLITRLPALKRVQVEQLPYASGYNNRMEIPTDSYGETVNKNYGYFADTARLVATGGTAVQSLYFEIDFNCLGDWDYSGYTTSGGDVVPYGGTFGGGIVEIYPQFFLQIKLDDAYSTTDYYWNGSSWQTSAASLTVVGGKLSNTSATAGGGTLAYRPRHSNQVLISTDALPATGLITVIASGFIYKKLTARNPNQYNVIAEGDMDDLDGQINIAMQTHLPRNSSGFVFTVENPNSGVKDYEVLDYGKITIGDQALNTGNIWIKRAITTAAKRWNVANGSQLQPIAALLAQQRLLIQSEVVKQYEGLIYMPDGYQYAIGIDSEVFIPLDYSFNISDGTVEGTWVKVGSYATAGTPIGTQGDLKILGAAFRGGFNAQQDAIEDRIQGLAFFENTNIINGKIFTGGQMRNNYRVIHAAAGDSVDLGEDDHVILFKWSGASGTFTVNLPDAATGGIEYEILTDSSITATQQILIEPDGSQQILEETNLPITGPGRLKIRSIDENWY